MKQKNKLLNLLSFVLLVLFLNSCTIKDKTNHWAEYNLFGNVETVKEYKYKPISKFGKIEKGNRIEQDNSLYKIFNREGYLDEENEIDYRDNLVAKKLYKNDQKNKQVEIMIYHADGSLYYKTIKSYNDNGDLIEEKDYNNEGYLFYKTVSKKDYTNNKVELNLYDSTGELLRNWFEEYDDKNLLIKTTDNDANALFSKELYKYDDKGNIIEKVTFTNILDIVTNATYVYEYDSKGNWIKKIEYLGSTLAEEKLPHLLIEREIEYYD